MISRLILPRYIREDIEMYSVLAAPNEVQGLGIATADGQDLRVLRLLPLPYQHIAPGSAQSTKLDMANWLWEITSRGIDPSQVHFWFHSHGEKSAFFSSVDEEQIQSWKIKRWMVSLVTNVEGDLSARLDIFDPIRLTFPLMISIEYDRKRFSRIKKEVQTRLRKEGAKDEYREIESRTAEGLYPQREAQYQDFCGWSRNDWVLDNTCFSKDGTSQY